MLRNVVDIVNVRGVYNEDNYTRRKKCVMARLYFHYWVVGIRRCRPKKKSTLFQFNTGTSVGQWSTTEVWTQLDTIYET